MVRFRRKLDVSVAVILFFLTFLLLGCDRGVVPPASSMPSTAQESLDSAWNASIAALEALGPTRVSMVETVAGRIETPGNTSFDTAYDEQTTEAEQLLDVANGRARLTVHEWDGMLKTTTVVGKECVSILSHSLSGTDMFVSADRLISLQPPSGLPLPLWAGNAVAPSQGYADLLTNENEATEGAIAHGDVQESDNGALQLSWDRSAGGVTHTMVVDLDPGHIPIRLTIDRRGSPTEGELQGTNIEYSLSIDYQYQAVEGFSDSDFPTDIPDDVDLESVTYELSLECPRSDQADWGQYWLGDNVGDWSLTTAQHAVHDNGPVDRSEAGLRDEAIFLFYERADKADPNEIIQVTVRPLRGRYYEDQLAFAKQRVDSGDWRRQELDLAGQRATVYSRPLETVTESDVDPIYVLLSDAMVVIQLWAPLEATVVLDALSPCEAPQ